MTDNTQNPAPQGQLQRPIRGDALSTSETSNATAKPKPAAPRSGRKGFEPEVRDRVLAAARKAMEKNGVDGVKARFIANEAGISVGSIYNMFDDLDALIRLVNGETYDELLALERAALDKARASNKSNTEQMLALAETYLEFVVHHQDRWSATLAFNRSRTQAPPKWYLQKELALFNVIEDAISAFPGAHDHDKRNVSARALWASVHGIVTMAVADGFLMQPVADVWQQITLVVEAVAASLENDPQ